MKTCPICGAVAFDDAQMCFGCLHSYDADAQAFANPAMPGGFGQDAVESRRSGADAAREVAEGASVARGGEGVAASVEGAVSFVLSFMPSRSEDGTVTWLCEVRPASGAGC